MSDIFKAVPKRISGATTISACGIASAPMSLGAAVLIVALTAGYRGWEYWRDRQAHSDG